MTDVQEAYRLLVADVYELAGTSRRTSEAIAATTGQTSARWHVLSVLSGGPATVATVARRLGLARQSVQRVGDDLVADGLVARHDNPDHRTAPLLALTGAGREALTALVARGDAARARVLTEAGVTARELLDCRDVLRRLTAALSASP
ncbi:DNA-binding transcriptional regulator, MarR family [Geodermatophilus amargosae]|uniref:DNA-binding transcriptional regulator, MarR family n=1 Tax=Geodermatophilus amargosae TaxID=1296565 RepID=A0A1I6Y2F3_9ACTN|nr:MarR family transcriptional regulator [Geodermatophilus amargosae]SFT44616.1 DNA-binding transcriptional regulator, MarR family [Geodermatophilus amargosae]